MSLSGFFSNRRLYMCDKVFARLTVLLPVIAWSCFALFLPFAASGDAQSQTQINNGIVITNAQVFDENALKQMLAAMEATLNGNKIYNQDSWTSALGRVQGGQSNSSSFSLQATTLPTASIIDTISGLGTADQTTGRVSTTSSQTPTPPEASPAGSATPSSAAALPMGVSAQDLLAEQTSLNYDIVNLRLLLEGALSDRFYLTPEESDVIPQGTPRTQVLMGLPINLNPTKQFKDAVAEIEVTVSYPQTTTVKAIKTIDEVNNFFNDPKVASEGNLTESPPRLVALYPASKSYNVAKTSTKTSDFGFGAIIQPILNVGLSSNRSGQTLYLVRATDTVASELPVNDDKRVKFKWQFRPVLGSHYVEPGIHQVYAAISIPPSFKKGPNGNGIPQDKTWLKVDVTTRWKKYNIKTGVVGDVIEPSTLWNCIDLKSIPALSPEGRDKILQPKVDKPATIEDIGNGQALVEIVGSNFSSEDVLLLNTTPIDASHGLKIQNEHRLQFIASKAELASGGGKLYLIAPEGGTQQIQYDSQQKGFTASKVALISQHGSERYYGIIGTNFIKSMPPSIHFGKGLWITCDVISPTLAVFNLTSEQTSGLKQIIVESTDNTLPVVLPITEPTVSPLPTFTISQPKNIVVGDEGDIVFTGTNFTSIDKITYLATEDIWFKVDPDGKQLTLAGTPALKEMRKSPGERTLHVVLKDGNQISLPLTVSPPVSPK